MTKFDEYIKDTKRVLLITSQPLDPDCISSGLVMKRYLEHRGINVTFRFPRELTQDEVNKSSYMPLFNEFINADTRSLLNEGNFDTLILLDGTNWVQFYDYKNKELPEPSLDKNKKIIQVDHHLGNPEDLTSLQIKDSQASSTIEIILSEIVPEEFLNRDLATLSYIGLMGDTGNFRWNFNSKTLKFASILLNKGADPAEALEHMFSMKKKEYLDALKYVLGNIEYDDETKTVFLLLPFEKIQAEQIDENKHYFIKSAFVSEISTYIQGYERGIFVAEPEKRGQIKLSSRGNNLTNKINLPALWKSLGGNGGGHFHAAGMEIDSDFEDFIRQTKGVLKEQLLKQQ
jgi:nanoRNase/pAp phosphatase (c-di-AMP/oligoRNAs hydrolase)